MNLSQCSLQNGVGLFFHFELCHSEVIMNLILNAVLMCVCASPYDNYFAQFFFALLLRAS